MTLSGNGLIEALTGRRFHLIGIGGSGMSALARILLEGGATVSGSDAREGSEIGELRQRGAAISIGHDGGHLGEHVDLVITSAAVPLENPERLAAAEQGVPVLKYAQMLGALMAMGDGIAVAGTHGKTTTTSMLAHLLTHGGMDPSFLIGADCPQLGGRARLGAGRPIVVEACEFDRSFLHLTPRRSAILNIEADHLDYYRDIHEIVSTFQEFAGMLPADGLLVANGDDANARTATQKCPARVESFGIDTPSDWMASNLSVDGGRYSYELLRRGETLGRVSLGVAGRHQVANSLAALALAADCGISPAEMIEGIESYQGVDRRMTVRGCVGGVTVIDDYAHHPTELDVTLRAIRGRYEHRRLIAVFQPHQYSRTHRLLAEFGASFSRADEIFVTDIYAARDDEATRRLVTAADLAGKICERGTAARASGSLADTIELLCKEVRDGDVVAVMGAGDVDRVAYGLVERLENSGAGRRAAG